MMTQTNELQFTYCPNIKQQANSVTQSQIMTNLNFSIEDLLSKISKVTNDYHYELSTAKSDNITEKYHS